MAPRLRHTTTFPRLLPQPLLRSAKFLRFSDFCLTAHFSRRSLPRMTGQGQGKRAGRFTRDHYSRLASRIAQQRQALGWKQRELSQRSGIEPDRLSRLERGAPIRIDELVGLSAAFGLRVEDLLFGSSSSGQDLADVAREIQSIVSAEDLAAAGRVFRALLAGFRALHAAREFSAGDHP
jgi:transcriptional regulator with XRE-family HTH domain